MTPIFIPSKGRPSPKTAQCFEDKSNLIVVVEPQDQSLYKNVQLAVLPKNDQGISYVRNWILDFARNMDLEKYWMLDDDISQFFEYEGQKGKKISGEQACQKAEEALTWGIPNLGQGAMEYNQFAWSQKKDVVAPGYCDVAVLMFPKKINAIRYRPELDLKEDRDFTLQILNAGMFTGRAAKIAFAAPKNGSNPGGLSGEYAKAGREREASERMIKTWPGICELNIKKDGRPDVKIHWRLAIKNNDAERF